MILSAVRFFLGMMVALYGVTVTENPDLVRITLAVAGMWHMVDAIMIAGHTLASRK